LNSSANICRPLGDSAASSLLCATNDYSTDLPNIRILGPLIYGYFVHEEVDFYDALADIERAMEIMVIDKLQLIASPLVGGLLRKEGRYEWR
jgi:hypothetical protein